jgi:uncharacterized protein (DUF983 family)
MPYRHAGPGLCTVCNSFTAGNRCPRCGRALCQEHAVPDTQRCSDCEAEYAQMAALVCSVPIVLVALQVATVVCICMLLVLVGQLEVFTDIGPYLSLAGGLMTSIFLASLAVILRRRNSVRERFLAEGLAGARPWEPAVDPPALPSAVRF